ncbi:hypothetical protein EUGRSUZ_D02558, partial [Eucalyptus grandis]
FRGARSRLTRTIIQQIRSLVSSHRDRDRKKIDFRRLWITQINAVIRGNRVSYSYTIDSASYSAFTFIWITV